MAENVEWCWLRNCVLSQEDQMILHQPTFHRFNKNCWTLKCILTWIIANYFCMDNSIWWAICGKILKHSYLIKLNLLISCILFICFTTVTIQPTIITQYMYFTENHKPTHLAHMFWWCRYSLIEVDWYRLSDRH